MADIVVVTGTPGAGKTTIINSLRGSGKYAIVGVGTMMQELATELGYTKNRDEIRYLSNQKVTELRSAVFRRIAAMDGRVIVDTHASVVENRRFISGLPFTAVKLLKGARALIYLDTTAEAIMSRRLRDKTRHREMQSAMDIENQRTMNLATLAYYASYLNIPLYLIDNKEGDQERVAKEFSESVAEIFGESK